MPMQKDGSECYSQERNVKVPSEGIRTYNFDDWPQLFAEPGVYRIAASINHYNDIPFQGFVVLEPAKIVEVSDPPQVIYKETESNNTSVEEPISVIEPDIIIEPNFIDQLVDVITKYIDNDFEERSFKDKDDD